MKKGEEEKPNVQESVPIPVEIVRLGIEEYLRGGHGPLPANSGGSVQIPGEEIALLGLEAIGKRQMDEYDERIMDAVHEMNRILPDEFPLPDQDFSGLFDEIDEHPAKVGKPARYFIERHNRRKNRRKKN